MTYNEGVSGGKKAKIGGKESTAHIIVLNYNKKSVIVILGIRLYVERVAEGVQQGAADVCMLCLLP